MKKFLAGLIGFGVLTAAAPAFAGEWRLDWRRCADIREDVRDAREDRRDRGVDRGRYDRREDRYDRRESRYDRRITVCPRSAFYYVPDRGERRARPPALRLSYDRATRMHYRYEGGRQIYVRG
jgi:hypothetical protein